jgi:hypothetical protein
MKKCAIVLFSIFILFSCGTRKVQIEKVKEDIKKDSVSQIVENKTLEVKNDIVSTNEAEETEIVAVDTSKAIVINGVSYKNAIIRHKKSKVNTIDKTIKKASQNALKRTEVKGEFHKQLFIKQSDKTSFTYYWLLLLLIIPLYYLFKKYRDKIWFV